MIVLQWLVWLCCIASVCTAQASLAFEQDSGLRKSEVRDWSEHTGSSHYRMRIYHFRANSAQLERMRKDKHMRLHSMDNPFDQAIVQLFEVVKPKRLQSHPSEIQRSPSWARAWGWFDLLPPYAQTWLTCHPQPPGFAFLLAVVHPPRDPNDLQEVFLAASGELPQTAAPSECQDSTSSFYMPMAAMLNPAADRLLPFPFAARSFAEMVAADISTENLHYHGTFFVDSTHLFRFKMEQAAFSALVKSRSMQAVSQTSSAYFSDGLGPVRPDWWLPVEAALSTPWFELCQILDQTPHFIRAAWHEGQVYWFTSGLRGPRSEGRACESPPVSSP